MGGGPSAAERRAQQEAEERSRQQQALQTQTFSQAAVPDPLEERLRERDINWLDWESGKLGPRDVQNAPLGAGLDLYSNAIKRQQGERLGLGALQMGANGSNPGLAQLLKQQSEDQRQQDAAGGLEQAVRMRSAEVNRSALPLAGFAQDRRMGLASLASNNANTSQGQFLNFLGRPQQRPFWQSLLLQGVQSTGQVASSKVMVGCVAIDTPILTPSGYVPIGELNEGDLAVGVTATGERSPMEIVRKRVTPNYDVLKVTNTEGEAVTCSPYDRLMFSPDDRSETFSPDDRSETFVCNLSEGAQLAQSTLKTIEPLPNKETVAIIKLGNVHENFGFITQAFLHLDDYAVLAGV